MEVNWANGFTTKVAPYEVFRIEKHEEPQKLEEFFVDLPPELCELKVVGFLKDMGSSISLLPSVMNRLGNLLVAIELKQMLSPFFPEAAEINSHTVRPEERFSLERLEVLGDAFLKFAVARHFFLTHDSLHEGDLTARRSNVVNNSNLYKLALKRNLQVYIHDQAVDPCQFYAFGRPCPIVCNNETEESIQSCLTSVKEQGSSNEIQSNKNHHWLYIKTIADAVEALVRAFIVDSDFKAAIVFLTWLGIQRLEFPGDVVLDFLITSYLYSAYPKLKPGQLTDLRSLSVNNKAFACVAVDRSFDKFLLCDSSNLY
ncbi:hypothetical protein AHAS_Ahas17G0103000 [Arachis hypogaea]